MKRIFAFLLAALAMLPLLASCNVTPSDPNGTEITTNEQGTTDAPITDDITEEPQTEPNIPEDAYYPNTTFRVLSRVSDAPTGWGNYDIVYDEDSELVVTEIKNAIKNRNEVLLNKLGVTVEQIATVKGVYNDAYMSLFLEEDDYDMILPSIAEAGRLAQEGLLLSMDELEYVDTEKPWYDQRCFEQLAIGGKNYFFFSDITVVNLDAIWLYYFNHDIITKYSLENPYELLADYKWTIDKLIEMCEVATNDADGVPTLDDEWGIAGHDYIITSLYHGTGEHIASTNEKGTIEITMESDRILTFIDKVMGLHQFWARYPLRVTKYVQNPAQHGFTVSGGHYETMLDAFSAGKILFMGEVLASARDLTSLDSDINAGILPTPMLEEAQREYFTPINDIAATSAIPMTVSDAKMVSIIVEFWAAESSKTLMPAYYDQAQKSRFSKDEISPDIIDLIFEARSYDLGASYAWGELATRLTAMIWDQDRGFDSMYDTFSPVAESELSQFLERFKVE